MLLAGGCGAVAIDLREVEFLDLLGVHELLRCREHALAQGAQLQGARRAGLGEPRAGHLPACARCSTEGLG